MGAPIQINFVPIGSRLTGSDRLGPKPIVEPISARALEAPEETSAKAAFTQRRAAIQSSLLAQQSVEVPARALNPAELGARARVAASEWSEREKSAPAMRGTDRDVQDEETNEFSALINSDAMRQRVELSVRLALPSEEPNRRLDVVV